MGGRKFSSADKQLSEAVDQDSLWILSASPGCSGLAVILGDSRNYVLLLHDFSSQSHGSGVTRQEI